MLDDKLKMRVGEAASCCVSPFAQPSAICGSKTNRNKTERRKQANNRKLELEMLVAAISNLLQKKERKKKKKKKKKKEKITENGQAGSCPTISNL